MFGINNAIKLRAAVILVGGIFLSAGSANAQAPRRAHVYDKLDAGNEAAQAGEARRLYYLNRQVQLNNDMFFWSRSFPAGAYWDSPWPYLPGDIYGYPLSAPRVNQPIGQRQEQVRRNTWVSYPVYADDPVDASEPPPAPSRPSTGPREF